MYSDRQRRGPEPSRTKTSTSRGGALLRLRHTRHHRLGVGLAACLALLVASAAAATAIVAPAGASSLRVTRTARTRPMAPILEVAGDTLRWARVPGASRYVLATALPSSRATEELILGTRITPAARPGKTVAYRVRADLPGAPWTKAVSISYRLLMEARAVSVTAPVLSVNNGTITWQTEAGVSDFTGAISTGPGNDTSRTTTYQDLGNATSWSPTPQPGQTLYYGVGANGPSGQTWALEVSISWPSTPTAPVLSVNNGTITWPAQAGVSDFTGAISAGPGNDASRTTTYQDLGNATSWSPTPQPGQTLYYGVAADGPSGQKWASEVSISWPSTPTAPVLSVNNGTITWPAQAGVSDFTGAISTGPGNDASRTTTYQDLGNATSWSPTPQPGQTLYYGVAADGPSGQKWASEVSISWPSSSTPTAPVLSVNNGTITWPAQAGVSDFTGAISTGPGNDASRTTTYQDLGNATSWSPTPQPGQTLYYGVAADGPSGQKWASEVSISWPSINPTPASPFSPVLPAVGISAGDQMQTWSSTDVDRELNDYANLHATWIRHDFAWDAVEPQQGDYQWSGFDQLVTAARARNINIIATIGYTPAWANGGYSDHRYAPTSATQFGQYAGQIATRYAPQGLHVYEIWNEPNISYWQPTPNPAAYTAILCAAYKQIHAADPQAIVLTGGASPAGDSPTTYAPQTWLEDLYADGAGHCFDAVAYHPYLDSSATHDDLGNNWYVMYNWNQPNDLRDVMTANGDANKKIWATEVGCNRETLGDTECSDRIQEALALWKTYPWAGAICWFTYSGPQRLRPRRRQLEPHPRVVRTPKRRSRVLAGTSNCAAQVPTGSTDPVVPVGGCLRRGSWLDWR